MMTFSSISAIVAKIYDISDTTVSLCFTLFLLSIVMFNFVAVHLLETIGISLTFKISAVGIIFGAWGRWFVTSYTGNFYYLLIF